MHEIKMSMTAEGRRESEDGKRKKEIKEKWSVCGKNRESKGKSRGKGKKGRRTREKEDIKKRAQQETEDAKEMRKSRGEGCTE